MRVKVEDHCQTADDVRAAAARVRARRENGRTLPPPVAKAPETMPVAFARPPAPPTFGVGIGHAYLPYHLVLLDHGRRQALRVTDILEAVAAFTGFSVIDIKSHRRTADVVGPRHLVMALSRRLTLRSLPEIGRMLDGRDHTTVRTAHLKYRPILDEVAERIGENASLAEWVAEGWAAVRAYETGTKRKAPRPPQQVAA